MGRCAILKVMPIFDAPEYDPKREKRNRALVAAVVVIALLALGLGWWLRHWPEEHAVDKFFSALQKKDYRAAYTIYKADPKKYPYEEFYKDWGPGGDWGVVNSYHIVGSAAPPNGSGVVVVVKVNGRADEARLWVEKKDKSLTVSPF